MNAFKTKAFVLVLGMALSGCSLAPGIKTPLGRVTAPKDAGTPAKLVSEGVATTVPIPAETKVTVTETEAQPATATTPAVPALRVTEWNFTKPTVFEQVASKLDATTGTIDTSVAKHRIDAAQRIWFLWVGLGGLVAGVVLRSALPAWPGLSNGLMLAGGLSIAAWKLAEIPTWVIVTILLVVGALALGYKRAELDKNGDGIPDILQPRPKQ